MSARRGNATSDKVENKFDPKSYNWPLIPSEHCWGIAWDLLKCIDPHSVFFDRDLRETFENDVKKKVSSLANDAMRNLNVCETCHVACIQPSNEGADGIAKEILEQFHEVVVVGLQPPVTASTLRYRVIDGVSRLVRDHLNKKYCHTKDEQFVRIKC